MVTLVENFRAVFYAPFYAAEALGAYAAEGIEVRMVASADAQRTLTSLGAGAGDVAWGGPLRILNALDRDRGGGYVAFCEVVGRDPFFLLGRRPRPDFTLAALAGLSLGVVTEVPTPWICLRYDMQLAGMDPGAVRLAPARSMPENAAALAAGDVDVIQVFQPYAEELVEAGAGHIWYAAAARGPTSYTTFNTTRAFLERDPKAALGMTRAMHRTLAWIAQHEGADLAAAVASYFPAVPLPRLTRCFARYKALGLWNTSPVVGRAGLEWLRDAMLASRDITQRIAFEECIDNRFAERSAAEPPPPLA